MDDAQRIAQLIVQRLEEGSLDEKAGLEEIADQFELSSRQIRRIVQKELGVPPIQLLLTRRLLLAKQLLTETTLPDHRGRLRQRLLEPAPVQRRVQQALSACRRRVSARRRRRTPARSSSARRRPCSSRIARRTTGRASSRFCAARALKGVEHVTDSSYARTVQLGKAKGWIRVTQSQKKHALMVEFTHSLTPVLPALLGRVRALFDLDARPDLIAKHLRKDARLAAGGQGKPRPARARAPSTDSRWGCARSSASR